MNSQILYPPPIYTNAELTSDVSVSKELLDECNELIVDDAQGDYAMKEYDETASEVLKALNIELSAPLETETEFKGTTYQPKIIYLDIAVHLLTCLVDKGFAKEVTEITGVIDGDCKETKVYEFPKMLALIQESIDSLFKTYISAPGLWKDEKEMVSFLISGLPFVHMQT